MVGHIKGDLKRRKKKKLNNNAKRVIDATIRLDKAILRRKKATLERMWIEQTKEIHLLNYLYYRYFTKSFERFLINRIEV